MTSIPDSLTPRKWTESLAVGIAMSLAFLLLSLTRLFGDMGSQAIRHKVLDSMLAGPLWDTVLARNIALFAAAVIAAHAALGVICWFLAILSERAWPRAARRRWHWTALWMAAFVIFLLLRNAAELPRSSLGQPYVDLATASIGGVSAATMATLLLTAAVITTVVVNLLQVWRNRRAKAARASAPLAIGAVAAIALTAAIPVLHAWGAGAPAATDPRPNVILIGLDSLRTDIVPVDGSGPYTPHLNDFLSGGTRFTDALTPLARTFPSWVALLTGRHPHSTGAVINLLPRERVQTHGTLGDDLSAAGYRTLYAIDEVRFSNIDETYGFQRVITPPIGSTEFLLSFVGDTPLLNLLVNTRAGELLFPHLHANRGAAQHYEPDRFVDRVERALDDDPRPLFLATHLTLAHWPYAWRGVPKAPLEPPGTPLPKIYVNAVRRVDQQFNDLLQTLERRGLLANAIVVVFSDHGETFGAESESLIPFESVELLQIGKQGGWGHGTSVLTPHQYRVVMGLRRYGAARGAGPVPRVIETPVSLEDIAPTLHDLLGTRARAGHDGQSLTHWLDGRPDEATVSARIRFTETEFNPASVVSLTGQLATSAVADAVQYYSVDPDTDRVELRPNVIAALTKARQVAAIGDRWLLAAVPSLVPGNPHIRLMVPIDGGAPRRIHSSTDMPDVPEAAALWAALEARFPAVLEATAPLSPSDRSLSTSDTARRDLTSSAAGGLPKSGTKTN